MLRKIKNFLKNRKQAKIKKSIIHRKAILDVKTYIEGRNLIGANTVLNSVYLGWGSYIGSECRFAKTKIGKYCSIASEVKIVVGEHPTKNWISTHPLFYSKNLFAGIRYVEKNLFAEFKKINDEDLFVKIGNDVWIGEGVLILSGVTIEDGAIIGAGSVVTKDVPAYAIVGGIPSKVIRYRFADEEIKFLKKYRWWDKEESWIKANARYFQDLEEFKKIKEI